MCLLHVRRTDCTCRTLYTNKRTNYPWLIDLFYRIFLSFVTFIPNFHFVYDNCFAINRISFSIRPDKHSARYVVLCKSYIIYSDLKDVFSYLYSTCLPQKSILNPCLSFYLRILLLNPFFSCELKDQSSNKCKCYTAYSSIVDTQCFIARQSFATGSYR